jgi:hypothetical protein
MNPHVAKGLLLSVALMRQPCSEAVKKLILGDSVADHCLTLVKAKG